MNGATLRQDSRAVISAIQKINGCDAACSALTRDIPIKHTATIPKEP